MINTELTGVLRNARQHHDAYGSFISGEIWGDTLGRYPDGHLLNTTYIVETSKEGQLIRTRGKTVYFIESWLPESRARFAIVSPCPEAGSNSSETA